MRYETPQIEIEKLDNKNVIITSLGVNNPGDQEGNGDWEDLFGSFH